MIADGERRLRWRQLAAGLALSGVLLRALVADGFMLVRAGDELALAPCPVRSPQLVQALVAMQADRHQHHAHHQHGAADQDGAGSTADAGSCPYALAAAAAVPPPFPAIAVRFDVSPVTASPASAQLAGRPGLRPPATGPPAKLS